MRAVQAGCSAWLQSGAKPSMARTCSGFSPSCGLWGGVGLSGCVASNMQATTTTCNRRALGRGQRAGTAWVSGVMPG